MSQVTIMIMPKFTRARPPYRTLSWPLGQRAMQRRPFSFLSHEKCAFHFWNARIKSFYEAATETAFWNLNTTSHIYLRPPARLSIGVREHSVYGCSFIARRISTSLWRCVRASRILRGIYFLGTDGSIFYGLTLHLLRHLTIFSFWHVIHLFSFGFIDYVVVWLCAHLVIQISGVWYCLHSLRNKKPIIKKLPEINTTTKIC
jgi:hypothetical protein